MKIALLLASAGLMVWQGTYSQSGWVLKRDRDGIIIHTRESAGSNLKEYRVEAVYDSPLESVYNFLTDLESRPEWVINCTGLEILDTLPNGSVLYHTSFDIPWPLADRDLVATVKFTRNTAGHGTHLLTEMTDLEYPLKKGVVRMPGYREEISLEKIDDTHTRSLTEGYADPGGTVPAWVVNMFLVDGTYDSVRRSRDRVAAK